MLGAVSKFGSCEHSVQARAVAIGLALLFFASCRHANQAPISETLPPSIETTQLSYAPPRVLGATRITYRPSSVALVKSVSRPSTPAIEPVVRTAPAVPAGVDYTEFAVAKRRAEVVRGMFKDTPIVDPEHTAALNSVKSENNKTNSAIPPTEPNPHDELGIPTAEITDPDALHEKFEEALKNSHKALTQELVVARGDQTWKEELKIQPRPAENSAIETPITAPQNPSKFGKPMQFPPKPTLSPECGMLCSDLIKIAIITVIYLVVLWLRLNRDFNKDETLYR